MDAIQTYLGTTETDMAVLWQRMVDKFEGREDISNELPVHNIAVGQVPEPIKKKGVPRKVK